MTYNSILQTLANTRISILHERRLQRLGEKSGGRGDKVIAGVPLPLELEQAEAVELTVFLLEMLAEGTYILGVAGEAADHGDAVDASAGLLQTGEAATEGSGHGLGLFGSDGQTVGKSHDH